MNYLIVFIFLILTNSVIGFVNYDEIVFVNISKSLNWIFSFQENFGSLFFAFVYLIQHPGLARLITFALLLISIFYVIKNSNLSNISIIYILSLPIIWWSGKIFSPDTYILILSLLIFKFFEERKFKLVFFIMGLAIGIKLTAFSLIFYIMFELLIKNNNKLICIKNLLLFCIGIFFGILGNINDFINLFIVKSSITELNFNNKIIELANNFLFIKYEWDSVIINFWGYGANPLLILMPFFVYGLTMKNKILYVLTLLLAFIFPLLSQKIYPWYFSVYIAYALIFFIKFHENLNKFFVILLISINVLISSININNSLNFYIGVQNLKTECTLKYRNSAYYVGFYNLIGSPWNWISINDYKYAIVNPIFKVNNIETFNLLETCGNLNVYKIN